MVSSAHSSRTSPRRQGQCSMRSFSMWTVHRPCRWPITRTHSLNGARTISSPLNVYTAYPEVTAKEIKALAASADVTGVTEQRPFLVVLPIKSKIAYMEVELLLRARGRGTTKDLDKVGTPHFAQFVKLEDNQIGFFTVYDGTFDTYIADFTKNIGQVFDLLFKFTKGAPPSPVRKHLQEFVDFAAGANRAPIGFYGGVSRFESFKIFTR